MKTHSRLSSRIQLRVLHSRLIDGRSSAFQVSLVRWWWQRLTFFGALMVLELNVMVLSRALSAEVRLATAPGEEDEVQDPACERCQLGLAALRKPVLVDYEGNSREGEEVEGM